MNLFIGFYLGGAFYAACDEVVYRKTVSLFDPRMWPKLVRPLIWPWVVYKAWSKVR